MSLISIPTFFNAVRSITNPPPSVILTWDQIQDDPRTPGTGQVLYSRVFSEDASRGVLEIDGTYNSNSLARVGVDTASATKVSVVNLIPLDGFAKAILSNAYAKANEGNFGIQWTDLNNPPDPANCPPFKGNVAFEIL